jgi:hypothetical protein
MSAFPPSAITDETQAPDSLAAAYAALQDAYRDDPTFTANVAAVKNRRASLVLSAIVPPSVGAVGVATAAAAAVVGAAEISSAAPVSSSRDSLVRTAFDALKFSAAPTR